ncbi:TfoX/Sxy family protein [Conexibacter sp. JD483]|uniref:TfoX/Sxy family protein n=1 Tax=unclassified Conexibacter TaxID=2627773 RepID=UPI002723F83B|nr:MULTISPECIES: TfoX/Sxy family protein [unclassified Conexibacter]MDO8188433.1 TfoX/Sxy family protein [Conexibacter sp. CPCC 205706]MDO8199206.1 TfoX/Sxy family protein [Conexibacter sp. CPCC 205762]MDR9372350.1 TfoX/Sxy family protein [Conexibacter sp. JD483]
MAYDEELASRLRALLSGLDGISERRMFGGLSFLWNGNLVCGVLGDTLVVRLGEAQASAALADPHVRLMDLQRRASRGTVYVDPLGARMMPRCAAGSSVRSASSQRCRRNPLAERQAVGRRWRPRRSAARVTPAATAISQGVVVRHAGR